MAHERQLCFGCPVKCILKMLTKRKVSTFVLQLAVSNVLQVPFGANSSACSTDGHKLHSDAGGDDFQRVALSGRHSRVRSRILRLWLVALWPSCRSKRTLSLKPHPLPSPFVSSISQSISISLYFDLCLVCAPPPQIGMLAP